MVTANVQYSLATAKGYVARHLSASDFFKEIQETYGEWIGIGARSLELIGGCIEADVFVSLCENIRQPWLSPKRRQRGHRSATDLANENRLGQVQRLRH